MADPSRARTTAKTTGKPAARRTAAPRKAAPRKARTGTEGQQHRPGEESSPDFTARLQTAGRNAFLASLGFYGKAFDETQEQFNNLQQQLEDRRVMADEIYRELVKRGRKVEKDTLEVIDEIDLPRIELESLTDRERLNEQLAMAKTRFEKLKESVGFKGSR